MKLSILVVAGVLVTATAALAGCGTDGWDGGGRGVPGGGGSVTPSTETDDLGGAEVPPDPQFDTATEDPPADPE